MTQYLKPPQLRVASSIPDIRKRIARLEARTSSIDSGQPLAMLAGVVSPSYTSGNPLVTIQGDTSPSGPYACLDSYMPVASDQVYLVPYHPPFASGSTTWIVIGMATPRAWVNVAGGAGFASALWSDAGAGFPLCSYKMSGDAVAAIRGRVTWTSNGTTGLVSGQTIFTLPAAYRPATEHYVPSACYGANQSIAASHVPTLEVQADGQVKSYEVTVPVTNGNTGVITFNGTFPLD